MTLLSPYRVSGSKDLVVDVMHSQEHAEARPQPFVSLLEFVSEIYKVGICFLSLLLQQRKPVNTVSVCVNLCLLVQSFQVSVLL